MKTKKRVRVFYRSIGSVLEDEINSFLEAAEIVGGDDVNIKPSNWGVLIEYCPLTKKKEEKAE